MRAKERRSNRLSAISERLSRNAWKMSNGNTSVKEESSKAPEASDSQAMDCSPNSTGASDPTLKLFNAWTQAIEVSFL